MFIISSICEEYVGSVCRNRYDPIPGSHRIGPCRLYIPTRYDQRIFEYHPLADASAMDPYDAFLLE